MRWFAYGDGAPRRLAYAGIVTEHDDAMIEAAARAAARMPRTAGAVAPGTALLFDEIGSTNTFAREALADGRLKAGIGAFDGGADDTGCGSGKSSIGDGGGTGRIRAGDMPDSGLAAGVIAVVATDTQTAGRGRLDHTWVSKAGESFTVSFVTRVPRTIATNADVNGWLQMIAGLSVRDALRGIVCGCDLIAGVADGAMPKTDAGRSIGDGTCGDDVSDVADCTTVFCTEDAVRSGIGTSRSDRQPDFQLKWPNDIYCDGKKLGGILAEMVMLPDDPRSVAVVLGVGLNLAVPADRLPTEQATSLQLHYRIDDDTDGLRDAIAARIVESLRSRLGAFVDNPDGSVGTLLKETRDCCWTLGKQVEAHFTDGSMLRGVALAINADASLTIRAADGNDHIVHTADVGVLA